jgi:hypothetical protein
MFSMKRDTSKQRITTTTTTTISIVYALIHTADFAHSLPAKSHKCSLPVCSISMPPSPLSPVVVVTSKTAADRNVNW